MVVIAAPSRVCCRLVCMCPGNRCLIICSLLCWFFFLSETLLTFARSVWITLIHVISCALSSFLCHTAGGEMCRTDEQHFCVLHTLGQGAMWHPSPTRRPYLPTHLPRLAAESKLKGFTLPCAFVSGSWARTVASQTTPFLNIHIWRWQFGLTS